MQEKIKTNATLTKAVAAAQPTVSPSRKMFSGFSTGQMFHYLNNNRLNSGWVTDDDIIKIKEQCPADLIDEAIRSTGTMGNGWNLHTTGYGDMELTANSLKVQQACKQSYIYNFVDLCQRLGTKSVHMTFNSHSPYLKSHTLEQSIASLKYVNSKLPVKFIELENETYLSIEVLKIDGNITGAKKIAIFLKYGINPFSKSAIDNWVKKQVNDYLDYLEFTVVPAIRKEGMNQPFGVSLCKGIQDVHKVWNEEVLKRNFYDFNVIHIYVDNDLSDQSIDREFAVFDKIFKANHRPIHVTEFGVGNISAKELEAFKNSRALKLDFHRRFNRKAEAKGCICTFNHALNGNSKQYSVTEL